MLEIYIEKYEVLFSNDDEVIIQIIKTETQIKLSRIALTILQQLENKIQLSDICNYLLETFSLTVTVEELTNLIDLNFRQIGLISNKECTELNDYGKIRTVRLEILESALNLLKISPLFNYFFFEICTINIIVSGLFLKSLTTIYSDRISLIFFPFSEVLILSVISSFIHEMGHYLAAKYFDMNAQIQLEIGKGTIFAKVNTGGAWLLSPKDRILIDLSGVFFQLIFCVVLFLIWVIFKNYVYLVGFLYNTFFIVISLSPFHRFSDGKFAVMDWAESKSVKNDRPLQVYCVFWTLITITMVTCFGCTIFFRNLPDSLNQFGIVLWIPLSYFFKNIVAKLGRYHEK